MKLLFLTVCNELYDEIVDPKATLNSVLKSLEFVEIAFQKVKGTTKDVLRAYNLVNAIDKMETVYLEEDRFDSALEECTKWVARYRQTWKQEHENTTVYYPIVKPISAKERYLREQKEVAANKVQQAKDLLVDVLKRQHNINSQVDHELGNSLSDTEKGLTAIEIEQKALYETQEIEKSIKKEIKHTQHSTTFQQHRCMQVLPLSL